jgi:DNA repair exonuclease SbcCD ATPase subunit
MDHVVERFRGALGGFNRKDVLRYIERTEADHRKQVEELEGRLAQAEAERAGLADSLSGLQDENGTMNAEKDRVRASLEQSTQTLARLRGELSQTESKLAVAKQELARLQGQVGELAPMAQSYQELKDRVATVELDAHRKAQATVDEAKGQAEALRASTAQWLGEVLTQYTALRGDMGDLLARMQDLAQIDRRLEEIDAQAQTLRERGGLQ